MTTQTLQANSEPIKTFFVDGEWVGNRFLALHQIDQYYWRICCNKCCLVFVFDARGDITDDTSPCHCGDAEHQAWAEKWKDKLPKSEIIQRKKYIISAPRERDKYGSKFMGKIVGDTYRVLSMDYRTRKMVMQCVYCGKKIARCTSA